MRKVSIKAICYATAFIVLAVCTIPGFRFWQQVRSGKTDYQQEIYSNYNGLLAVGILLMGILVAAAMLWVARRFAK
jgi:hypothetical protein